MLTINKPITQSNTHENKKILFQEIIYKNLQRNIQKLPLKTERKQRSSINFVAQGRILTILTRKRDKFLGCQGKH